MTVQAEPGTSGGTDTGKNIVRRLFQVSFSIILTLAILLISSGQLNWIYAWVYTLASVLVIIVNAFIFPAELISERGRKKANVEKWDKIVTGLITIPWFALYLVAGLDHRFGWSAATNTWAHIAALITFLSGNAIVSLAMIANNYFSTKVRIQYDRGHTVSSSGPYSYVRHPGYLGIIIFILSTPLIFGSFWAMIPAFATVILFIIRTYLEDITLKEKLEGYKDYAGKVKFRILPGIW